MDAEVAERRAGHRHPGSSLQLTHATLRPGYAIRIVDISEHGLLVETTRPLRPGTRVHLRLVSEHWNVNVAAIVLRCGVSIVHPNEGVTYRGALKFEKAPDVASG